MATDTKDGNGRDPMFGAPWQVKLIIAVGAPMALLMWLVWSDRTQLQTVVELNRAIMTDVQADTHTHDVKVDQRFDGLMKAVGESNRILLATCSINAKTDDQRKNCAGSK